MTNRPAAKIATDDERQPRVGRKNEQSQPHRDACQSFQNRQSRQEVTAQRRCQDEGAENRRDERVDNQGDACPFY